MNEPTQRGDDPAESVEASEISQAIQAGREACAGHEIITAKIAGLMVGYHARWCNEPLTPIAVESEFSNVPILNPDTNGRSRTFTQAGLLDAVVRNRMGTFSMEHKTTSEDITDPNSPYMQQLAVDSQISMYDLAHRQAAYRLDGCIYDIIHKPTINPKQIPKGSVKKTAEENVGTLREITEVGQYFGFSVTGDERHDARWALSSTKIKFKETPDLYARRLAFDCLTNPDKYYRRQVITRANWAVAEWAQELWNTADTMRQERKQRGLPRKISGGNTCFSYSRPCSYLGICSGHDEPDSGNWVKREKRHTELNLKCDGLNVLSNSRIKTWNSCHRKHYYRYELGIERRDEERSEALFFGSAFHKALEAWLNARKEKTNGGSTEEVFNGGYSEQGTEPAF